MFRRPGPDQWLSVLQTYGHPDVVECSLVVLHLARGSTLVTEALQTAARDLLRRYASSPDTQRAARRFLN